MEVKILEEDYLDIKGNHLYELSNEKITVEIMCLGATLLSVHAPDRNGIRKNVVLKLDYSKGHVENSIYAGTIIAPSAGRIEGGKIIIEGREYELSQNEGENNLHGGYHNTAKALWKENSISIEEDHVAIELFAHLKEELDGFPGNRDIIAKYILNEENTLKIEFKATSDKATYFNLTNHSYFNMSGDFKKDIREHSLMISADKVLYNDFKNIPYKSVDVEGTPYDFRKKISMNSRIDECKDNEQFKQNNGYNNAFLLNHSEDSDLIFMDEESGRRLTINTDMDSIVVYSGTAFTSDVVFENGVKGKPYSCLALEAQFPPGYMGLSLCNKSFEHYIDFTFDVV